MSEHVDPTYGHVTIHDDGRYPLGHLATIVDLGNVAQINLGPAVNVGLDPDQARMVGSALISWASRKRLAQRQAERGAS